MSQLVGSARGRGTCPPGAKSPKSSPSSSPYNSLSDGSRRVSVCLDVSCRPLSACTRRLVLAVSFVFNRAEKRRRRIHLRPSLSSVVSAGTRTRVLGGCAVSFLVLLGAIHRAGHTASGLPRSFISAPVTPRGTGAPCTHVSHRIPCSNPIVFDTNFHIIMNCMFEMTCHCPGISI